MGALWRHRGPAVCGVGRGAGARTRSRLGHRSGEPVRGHPVARRSARPARR